MNFLITGITGFSGPHLANLLIENSHKVYGLVRCSNGREADILDVVPEKYYNEITFIYGDIKSKKNIDDIFKKYKFDGVFHLAAQSHPPTSFNDPAGTFEDNITGSANIINAIVEYQPECKLMFCSTSEVYGNVGSDGHILKTSDRILPSNPYGVSKAAIDLYMQERMTNGKITGYITRAFSHTGPRRGKTFSISSDAFQIATMINTGKKTLSVGNLQTTRVVIDVRDTVRAYYLLMITEKSNGKAFNVCGDIPRKMEFFTDKLIELSGLINVEKVIDPKLYRPIDIYYQHGDTTELKEITGWKPTITIEKTLSDLLRYWKRKIWEN